MRTKGFTPGRRWARSALGLMGVLVGVSVLSYAPSLVRPLRSKVGEGGGIALAQIQTAPLPTYTPAERAPRESLPREQRRVLERDQSQAAPTPSPAPTP